MTEALTSSPEPVAFSVAGPADVHSAGSAARTLARQIGFSSIECEEMALAATELASNLAKHAGHGMLHLSRIETNGQPGLQIVSEDNGPGIRDIERALADGFSTKGTLGTGLGTVNRLMDTLEFYRRSQGGLRVVSQRWVRPALGPLSGRRLEIGVATRAYRLIPENGDAFIVRQWEAHALVGIIDGLGHGQFAHRAAQTARQYIEQHFDQPLPAVFRGVSRACRATRGVVMMLARFELTRKKFVLANIGNVEARLLGSPAPFQPIIRRGILGVGSGPEPPLTEHSWTPTSLLILHSDGVQSRWTDQEVLKLAPAGTGAIAQMLVDKYGRVHDDSTVVVVRDTKP